MFSFKFQSYCQKVYDESIHMKSTTFLTGKQLVCQKVASAFQFWQLKTYRDDLYAQYFSSVINYTLIDVKKFGPLSFHSLTL